MLQVQPALAAVALASLVFPAAAQGGGFQGGDLFALNTAVTGAGLTDSALVRIDMSSGTATMLVDTYVLPGWGPEAAWDPYRQRLLFFAAVGSDPLEHLWATDAAGQLTDLGLTDHGCTSLAPMGDGRVYLRDAGPDGHLRPFLWLDPTGAVSTLMDETGTAAFKIDGNGFFDARGIVADPDSNALLVVSGGGAPCPGGLYGRVGVHRLTLSPDGSRVVGPVNCVEFDVSSSATELPVGCSRGPAGAMVVAVYTGLAGLEPRLLLVDMQTLDVTPFATLGNYPGADTLMAGTWSDAAAKSFVLDAELGALRAFAPGDVGAGTLVPLTGTPLSSPTTTNEAATLVAIPPSSCAGGWLAYGSGLAGSGGLVPRLFGAGCPQIGGGLQLVLDRVAAGASGTLFVGTTPLAAPFKGGSFLVGALALSLPLSVDGSGALTLPGALPNLPVLQGTSLFLQAGFHDAGAVHQVSLTQGLRIEIG